MLEHFVKLSPAEVIQFKKFVASPYFNTNRKVVLLTNYLSVRYPDLDNKVLNKKVIYRFVFRNQKYNDANFRKLNSDFNSVFKRFLTEIEVESNNHLKKSLLLKKYEDLKIFDKMKHVHDEIINTDRYVFSKDFYYYINMLVSEYTYYKYAIYDNAKEKIKNFEAFCESADLLIIYIKLHLYQIEIFLNPDKHKDFKDKYSLKKEIFCLFEEHIDLIKQRHPDIFFMHSVIRIDEDDSYFYELTKYFNKNKKLIKGDLAEGYMKSYVNYYDKKFNSGEDKDEAAKKLFKFYDNYFVRNKPVTEVLVDGYVPPGLFLGAVYISLYMNKYSWVEKFIDINKNYLPELIREEIYCLAKANILFQKKDFKSTLEYLSKIKGIYEEIESLQRIFRLMIYYEMQDSEGIRNQLINLKTFRNNKKTSNEIVTTIDNFLKYFNILLKIINMEKKQRREDVIMLKKKLDNEKSWIYKRHWFIEKINELENS